MNAWLSFFRAAEPMSRRCPVSQPLASFRRRFSRLGPSSIADTRSENTIWRCHRTASLNDSPFGSLGSSPKRLWSSCGSSPLWQVWQRVIKFSLMVGPRFSHGLMWWTCNSRSTWLDGERPQTRHLRPSRFITMPLNLGVGARLRAVESKSFSLEKPELGSGTDACD